MEARIMMFVVPGEHPNLTKTSETLATITGGRVTVLDTRPFMPSNKSGNAVPMEGKKLIEIHEIFCCSMRKILEHLIKYLIVKIFFIFLPCFILCCQNDRGSSCRTNRSRHTLGRRRKNTQYIGREWGEYYRRYRHHQRIYDRQRRDCHEKSNRWNHSQGGK